jgi:hypothetical protein
VTVTWLALGLLSKSPPWGQWEEAGRRSGAASAKKSLFRVGANLKPHAASGAYILGTGSGPASPDGRGPGLSPVLPLH